MDGAAIEMNHGEIWLPPDTVVQRQFAIHFPNVRGIHADIYRAFMLVTIRAHLEHGRISREKICKSQAGRLAIESHTPVVERISIRVQPPQGRVNAQRDLVVSFDQAEIVRCRKDGVSCWTRRNPDSERAI